MMKTGRPRGGARCGIAPPGETPPNYLATATNAMREGKGGLPSPHRRRGRRREGRTGCPKAVAEGEP